jgi:hypothetical protein
MAKQTAVQRKAAAKKAAATKAANAKAAETSTTQTGAQTGTDAIPATDAQGTTDAQTSTDEQPQTNAPKTQTGGAQVPVSIFDQAVAFSGNGRGGEAKAPSALDVWNGAGCADLPPKLAVAVFDCAVRQGEKVTARLLGKIGITPTDGQLDEAALEWVAERDEEELVIDFLAWRLRRYAFTGNASTKMLEWSQHILSLQAFVLCDLDAG